MRRANTGSPFAEALAALLDQTNLFDRSEWAEVLGVSEPAIFQWVGDKTIPRADNLHMIVITLERSTDVPAEPLVAFRAMANRPATEVSPHGKRMLPTVWEYMMRPAFSELSSKLAKLPPEEQEQLLEKVIVMTPTLTELILLAAHDLDRRGLIVVSPEDLAVQAWQLGEPGSPLRDRAVKALGLAGYAALHPDHNKVASTLASNLGPVHKGWLRPVGTKRYALTQAGRLQALTILGDPTPDLAGHLHVLDVAAAALVARLLDSQAVRLMDQGKRRLITTAVALEFWDLPPNAKGKDVRERLDYVRGTLTDAATALEEQDGVIPGPRVVTAGDCRKLLNVHLWLVDAFHAVLDLMQEVLP